MSKDKYEEEAKDHLISELKQRGRGDWNVIATDVEVDPLTHINFDYQLQFADRLIALEVFRLVESKEEIERSKSWSLISNKIAEELVSRNAYLQEVNNKLIDRFRAMEAKIDQDIADIRHRFNERVGQEIARVTSDTIADALSPQSVDRPHGSQGRKRRRGHQTSVLG